METKKPSHDIKDEKKQKKQNNPNRKNNANIGLAETRESAKLKRTFEYFMKLKESKKDITCNDKKCPYHGNLSVHGRILFGKVKKISLGKNAYVQWNWLRFIPKYERYEKKTSTVVAHIPSCIEVNEGDNVYIAETRKLSKTKNFVVMEVVKN